MKNILFIAPNKSTFVKKDIEILQKKFNVIVIESKAENFFNLLKSQIVLLFKLLRNLNSTSLYYIWFADYHSFLPSFFSKIFKIKSILVIGGSDVNYIPDLEIGNIIGPMRLRKFCVIYSLNNSNLLLPVDKSLIEYKNTYVNNNSYKMGITFFSNNKNINVLPTGIDTRIWQTGKKKKQFITVAISSNYKRIVKKGVDTYLEIAKLLPEYDFYLIGVNKEELSRHFQISKNIKIFEYLEHEELSTLLAESKTFLLLSFSEGLPNVLLEAMASGCIPIVSNVNGMPSLVKGFGYVLDKKDQIEQAKNYCLQSLNTPDHIHHKIEIFIKENFNLRLREEKLQAIITKIFNV